MSEDGQPLFIPEKSLMSFAYDNSIEMIQEWEMLPFYLDEDKPLHGTSNKVNLQQLEQFIRIPINHIPEEIQSREKPVRVVVKKTGKGGIVLDKQQKQEVKKMEKEEGMDWNENFSDDDNGDYEAGKFEDYDQEDEGDDSRDDD